MEEEGGQQYQQKTKMRTSSDRQQNDSTIRYVRSTYIGEETGTRLTPRWRAERLAWTPGRAVGHLPAWGRERGVQRQAGQARQAEMGQNCSSSAICRVLRARGHDQLGESKRLGVDGDLN